MQAEMCERTPHKGESITFSIMRIVIVIRVTWWCHSLSCCRWGGHLFIYFSFLNDWQVQQCLLFWQLSTLYILPATGNFVTEIQSMMHGFGDARTPLLESATLIETVVQQQQWALISQAADISIMRGAKSIGPEDILFLLRKDPVKTHRLLKYLGTSALTMA